MVNVYEIEISNFETPEKKIIRKGNLIDFN